jgi:hypothetical protein
LDSVINKINDLKSRIFRDATGYKNKVPNTSTRTDHAISIKVRGKTIGSIQEWGPQQSRTVEPLYEINVANSGNVAENIPGIIGGLIINVLRYDLFSERMEQAWGPNFNITMLTDQTNPLVINERFQNPNGIVEMWSYLGCWFTSLGRTHSANGDRIVKVNATLTYSKKYKVSEIDVLADEFAEKVSTSIKNRIFG